MMLFYLLERAAVSFGHVPPMLRYQIRVHHVDGAQKSDVAQPAPEILL
jgi:hypothetical protein